MNTVYFAKKGEQGLTSTQANFLANMAKEMQEEAINSLNNVGFYDTYVSIIGQEGRQLMSMGHTCDFLADLELVSSLNSFCAWVREAIKEKDSQMESVKFLDVDTYCSIHNIEKPTVPICPEKPKDYTEEDIMSQWDINKRYKYLKLEAFAATFGKYIHPAGSFAKARKDAYHIANVPLDYQGEGRDTIFFHRELNMSRDNIEETFMSLQSHYRSYEKELNYLKAELKDSVTKLNHELHEQYVLAYEQWSAAYKDYNEKMIYMQQQLKDFKLQELDRVANLRIAIPNELKQIFELIKTCESTK